MEYVSLRVEVADLSVEPTASEILVSPWVRVVVSHHPSVATLSLEVVLEVDRSLEEGEEVVEEEEPEAEGEVVAWFLPLWQVERLVALLV